MSKSFFLTAVMAGFLGYLLGQLPIEHQSGSAPTESDTVLETVAEDQTSSHYTCPMHPNIVSDVPGHCPVCGMDLVETHPDTAVENDGSLPTVTVTPSVVHNLGVRTARAEYGDLQRRIDTIGKITRVDPMARRTITPPIRGELVSIADKHDGDFIVRGEQLFTIKSDKLFEHEKAFQDAYQAGDRATANAMIPKLSKMGLTPEQIAGLQTGEAPEMLVKVNAFEDGFIYSRRGRIGEKVHTGFTVFNVGGNYRVIEVTAEIFERQWGWVEQGQKARMTVRGLPGTVFEGKVVRVEPPVGYTTRSLEVALKFRTDNPELSQSMFAHVSIDGQTRKHVLLVPTDSVIRTGKGDRVVVVRGKDRFQPVPVVAGEEAGGQMEIRSGLKVGDKVVASGQFLIDSESSLLAGLRRMVVPRSRTPDHSPPHQHADAHPPHKLRPGDRPGRSGHDIAPVSKMQHPERYHPVNYNSPTRF